MPLPFLALLGPLLAKAGTAVAGAGAAAGKGVLSGLAGKAMGAGAGPLSNIAGMLGQGIGSGVTGRLLGQQSGQMPVPIQEQEGSTNPLLLALLRGAQQSQTTPPINPTQTSPIGGQ